MGYSYAAAVEASLEAVAELGEDPTERVYARLFAANPDMAALFWRDTNGAIKGEMLSRVFAAILDFVSANRVDHVLIGARRDSFRRRVLGSVSAKVATEAACSVTIVRAPRVPLGDA